MENSLFFEIGTWSLALFAICGVVLNIKKKRICFLIWCFTNVTWAAVDISRDIYAQGFLHIVYLGLSVWGWFQWKKDDEIEPVITDG